MKATTMNPVAINFRKDVSGMSYDERQTKLNKMATHENVTIWKFQPRNEFNIRCGEYVYVKRHLYFFGLFAYFTVEKHPF